MKKKLLAISTKMRQNLIFALLAAFLILPSLSVVGWVKDFRLIDSRKVGNVQRLQTRAMDANAKPSLFNEPLVSVTFDDGWESIYTTAFPLLQKYGIRSTQYIISGELKEKEYMSVAQIKAMQQNGHDVACHSVSHVDLVIQTDDELTAQLKDCKDTLSKVFGQINDFASPYGSANDKTRKEISKYFRTQRNTVGDISDNISDADVNTAKNFNQYDIIATTIRRDTSVAQIKQLLDYATKNNAWVVLTYHQIDDGASQYGLDAKLLEEQLKAISEYKARIVTVNDVMNSLPAQKRSK